MQDLVYKISRPLEVVEAAIVEHFSRILRSYDNFICQFHSRDSTPAFRIFRLEICNLQVVFEKTRQYYLLDIKIRQLDDSLVELKIADTDQESYSLQTFRMYLENGIIESLNKFTLSDEEKELAFKQIDDIYQMALSIVDQFVASLQSDGILYVQELEKEAPPYAMVEEKKGYFVDLARIRDLKSIHNKSLDFSKLIQFCTELNICYRNDCHCAVAMLTRAILDHIPPIFGCANFSEVANNYNGTKSFRESMQHLDNSLRKIADSHLHTKMRAKETLPTPIQVDFRADLDVLLSEIIRVHK